LQPYNHQSFDYSYRVSSKLYTGHSTAGGADRKFETIKPGDTLSVFYDTTRPDHSTAGPPGMPGVQAISGLVGACIAIPLLIMGVLHQLRLLPPWKLFTPGPESHESLPSNRNAQPLQRRRYRASHTFATLGASMRQNETLRGACMTMHFGLDKSRERLVRPAPDEGVHIQAMNSPQAI